MWALPSLHVFGCVQRLFHFFGGVWRLFHFLLGVRVEVDGNLGVVVAVLQEL